MDGRCGLTPAPSFHALPAFGEDSSSATPTYIAPAQPDRAERIVVPHVTTVVTRDLGLGRERITPYILAFGFGLSTVPAA
jgi:hypothetical protein